MKVLELIANAEWWIGNGYRAAGRRLDNMSEAVWKRMKPGAVIKSMPDKLRAKIKKMKSKDFQDVRDEDVKLLVESPNKVSNDLKEKFDEEVARGRVSSKND